MFILVEEDTNLKQVIIWKRFFTQHYSVIITVHSSSSGTVTVQCNELTTVLMEEKSERKTTSEQVVCSVFTKKQVI